MCHDCKLDDMMWCSYSDRKNLDVVNLNTIVDCNLKSYACSNHNYLEYDSCSMENYPVWGLKNYLGAMILEVKV